MNRNEEEFTAKTSGFLAILAYTPRLRGKFLTPHPRLEKMIPPRQQAAA
jgi:hypothetical protein